MVDRGEQFSASTERIEVKDDEAPPFPLFQSFTDIQIQNRRPFVCSQDPIHIPRKKSKKEQRNGTVGVYV